MTPAATPLPPAGPTLLETVLALLTPMFFAASGGDPHRARQAAREAIAGLEALPIQDLLFHAQTIAMGIASMQSYAEAATPGLLPAVAVRLRANANALSRSTERRKLIAQKAQELAAAPQEQPPKARPPSTPAAAPNPPAGARNTPATGAPHPAWADAFSQIAQDPDLAGLADSPHHAAIRAALNKAAQDVRAAGNRTTPRQTVGER